MDGGKAMNSQTKSGRALVVAGLGSRRACEAHEIVALVGEAIDRARNHAGIGRCRVTALAAPAFKKDERALLDAATDLGLPLLWIEEAAMHAAEPRCETRSDRALEATGFASVAEAAALAAAGPGSRLILPRINSAAATCALAERGLASEERTR